MIFKAVLVASKMWPPCPYKPLSFQTLRYPQFLSNFQSPKFKFSVSGKKNVCQFGVMTKTSVSSEKNVPLSSFLLQSMFFAFKSNFYIGKALEFLLKSIAKAFSALKRTLLYKANAKLHPR